MSDERMQLANLDQHIGEWLQGIGSLRDMLTRYSNFMLAEVSKGRTDLESSQLQVQEQILDLDYKVLMIGLLLDIRNHTASSAYQLESGINVQGDVYARIVG